MSIRSDLQKVYSFNQYNGNYGLEIEAETLSRDDYPKDFMKVESNEFGEKVYVIYNKNMQTHWKAVPDGSLRNFGTEFIFKRPLSLDTARKALNIFKEESKGIPFLPSPYTCSVHVHVNMAKENFITLGNFLTTWTLFENILVEYSGEGRRSNFYSLPVRCAEGLYLNIVNMFSKLDKGDPFGLSFSSQMSKYGSLNLSTMATLGSVEVRTFRGTTNADEIIDWIEIIDKILTFSKSDITPPDIVYSIRELGQEGLFRSVFKEKADKLSEGINVEKYVDKNLYYAGSISSSSRDWHKLESNFKGDIEKAGPKRKRKNRAGGGFFSVNTGEDNSDDNSHAQPSLSDSLTMYVDEAQSVDTIQFDEAPPGIGHNHQGHSETGLEELVSQSQLNAYQQALLDEVSSTSQGINSLNQYVYSPPEPWYFFTDSTPEDSDSN